MQRRGTDDPSGLGVYPNWAWSWPANRRVLYNRASCDPDGKPWDPDRKQIWWNEAQQRWVGNDVPDFKADSPPKDHMGPFIMNAEGVGRIFAPAGGVRRRAVPGALRADREPDRRIRCIPSQSNNPVVKKLPQRGWTSTARPAEGYNIVCTTYRLTEHYHYWTKNNPMNVQLVPEPFVEIPAELADELGLRGGEKVKVTSARGHYIAKAMVTRRIKPHDDRRQEDLSDRHPDSLGLSRHRGGRGQDRADAGQPALARGHRSQRLHAGVQGLPGEAGEGCEPRRPLRIQAISGHAGTVPGRGTQRAGARRQADRHHHLHRLQGLRSGVPGMERPARSARPSSTTPTRPCRRRRGITGT